MCIFFFAQNKNLKSFASQLSIFFLVFPAKSLLEVLQKAGQLGHLRQIGAPLDPCHTHIGTQMTTDLGTQNRLLEMLDNLWKATANELSFLAEWVEMWSIQHFTDFGISNSKIYTKVYIIWHNSYHPPPHLFFSQKIPGYFWRIQGTMARKPSAKAIRSTTLSEVPALAAMPTWTSDGPTSGPTSGSTQEWTMP